jgi:alkylresorcinol/alkylpyrone synthase
MARIVSAARALPPFEVTQEQAKDFARHHFGRRLKDVERLLPVFSSSRIASRRFCVPAEWFISPKSFQEKNDTYIKWALKLSEEAAVKCLDNAGLSPQEVDHIIFVSTTGLATPSIDARLINSLKMRSDITRVPVWGLGCVGGAAGLSMAARHIKAYPQSRVLLVAVELCGLTFQFDDFGKSNLVATALFGDGAAAVLLSSDGEGPEIVDSQSTIWYDSLYVMGWNILNEGMQVVFAKAIPAIVAKHARANISRFIAQHNLTLENLKHFLIHPGGAKVVDAYREALGVNCNGLRMSEEILRENGNMSSVTVLYILERFLSEGAGGDGDYGIISALGPGFSSETLLFRSSKK